MLSMKLLVHIFTLGYIVRTYSLYFNHTDCYHDNMYSILNDDHYRYQKRFHIAKLKLP